MTKTHFEAIAAILDANGSPEHTVEDFADYFASINPRFDRKRFLAASLRGRLALAKATIVRLTNKGV
jgi:hypothetical protein